MSKGHLLIISERSEDLDFGKKVAQLLGASFDQVTNVDALRRILVTHKNAVIFWNTENQFFFETFHQVIPRYLPAHRIFSIADGPVSQYVHLAKYPVFAHHLLRRFADPAPVICSNLARVALGEEMFGLENYFPKDATLQKIKIARSTQKTAAVEAIQKHLTKQAVLTRMAALIAQSVDELIMNAMFDAPIEGKERLNHGHPRDIILELNEKQAVEVTFAACEEYMGISVVDQFGSPHKNNLIHALFSGPKSGLHAIYETGLSLLFVIKPQMRTEVILIFPRSESYKEFRSGFRCLSLVESKEGVTV